MSISSRWTPPCVGAPSCARQGAQVYLHSLFPYLLDKLLVCLENELETREESQGGGGGGRRAEVASPWSLDERLGPEGGGAAHGTPEEDVHAGLVGPPAGTLHHPPVARGPVLHQRGLLPPGEQDGQHPLCSWAWSPCCSWPSLWPCSSTTSDREPSRSGDNTGTCLPGLQSVEEPNSPCASRCIL